MERPDPADYAPALAWWGHAWRVLVALGVSALVWTQVLGGDRDHPGWLVGLDLALGCASLVLALLRRRWPLTVALLTALMSAVSGLAAGPSLLAAVSLATRRVLWQVGAVGAASVLAGVVYNWVEPPDDAVPWLANLGLTVAVTAALLAFGMYVGSRRELLWSLRERARAAEDQQEMRMSAARSAERERIAREMHDVLGHRISMVSMHAGALAYRTDLPAAQVRETAGLIQRTSHQALTDLRQVLGTLRDDGRSAGPTQPQPRLGDLPALVDEARAAGMTVTLALEVTDRDDLSEALGRTVYRVVQEGLTNARKHARGCPVTVRVVGGPGTGIDVRVLNDARPLLADRSDPLPGSGLGLVGLSERAELVGGRVGAGRQGEEFVLHGWLPWAT